MMDRHVLHVTGLPPAPLDAAAQFHAEHLPKIRAAAKTGSSLAVLFPPAPDHSHRNWRLAAMQELAREAAPARVNGLEGGSRAAIEEAQSYLASAPAITGQLMALDGNPAQND